MAVEEFDTPAGMTDTYTTSGKSYISAERVAMIQTIVDKSMEKCMAAENQMLDALAKSLEGFKQNTEMLKQKYEAAEETYKIIEKADKDDPRLAALKDTVDAYREQYLSAKEQRDKEQDTYNQTKAAAMAKEKEEREKLEKAKLEIAIKTQGKYIAMKSASEKVAYFQDIQNATQANQKRIEQEIEFQTLRLKAEGKTEAEIRAANSHYYDELKQLDEDASRNRIRLNQLETQNAKENLKKSIVQGLLTGGLKGVASALQDDADKKKETLGQARETQAEAQRKYDAIMSDPNATDEDKDRALQQLNDSKADTKAAEEAYKSSQKLANTMQNVAKAVDKLGSVIDNSITAVMQSSAKLDAQLQGNIRSYRLINEEITANLTGSPLLRQENMWKNIESLADKGVVYNLEQRAYIQTLRDKIAPAFDVANKSLLELVRIQQADVTISRLAIYSSLTKYFNNMFEDSSYISEQLGTISDNIQDASVQLTRDQSLEFEYIVNKWLGSLYSVGVSSEAIGNISKGLNYLGTGDVSSLTSNDSLQTLIAMSISRAGLDYGQILTGGLTAETTNELLKSMVEYLKEIAENDNMVVKSAYGNILGLSTTDLRAILNLSDKDVTNIDKKSMSYLGSLLEYEVQIAKAFLRTTTPEMIENVYQNTIFTIGQNIAANPATAFLWKLNSLVEGETGGINIPFVNAMGFGLDLNANINQLVKLGLVGLGTLGMLPKMVSSLALSTVTLGNGAWLSTPYTSRGTGFTGITNTGVTKGTSESVTTGDTSDMQNSTLSEATDSAEDTKKITNKNSETPEYTAEDIYISLFQEKKVVQVAINDLGDNIISNLREMLDSYYSANAKPDMAAISSKVSEIVDNTTQSYLTYNGQIGVR